MLHRKLGYQRSPDDVFIDRVTNVVFMLTLCVTAAVFLVYGPEAACRHIATVVSHALPSIAVDDVSLSGFMAD